MQQLLEDVLPDQELPSSIEITNIDKIARQIVWAAGVRFTIATREEQEEALRDARQTFRSSTSNTLERLRLA